MKTTLFYATGNPGKFTELDAYVQRNLPNLHLQQFDKDLNEFQSLNQREIAIHKAQQAYDLLKQPVLVDDSGIYFRNYKDFPGTLSKFIHHTIGFEGMLKLVQQGDPAEFVLTLVYYYAPNTYECFEGRCEGIIKYDATEKAPATLPYDILFSPENTGKTYAQLRSDIKEFEKYNYRIRAFKQFVEWYNQQK